MAINNNDIYNAVLSGTAGASQERWIIDAEPSSFEPIRDAVEAIAIAVDALIPTATISSGQTQLMQAISLGVFSTRFPTSSDPVIYEDIAIGMVGLWTEISPVLAPAPPPGAIGTDDVTNDSTVTGITATDALNTLLATATAQGVLIGNNATAIGTNATAIGVNAGNISTNATDIGTNATAIGVNAGNISTNTTDIGTNATAIGVNAGNISTNTTDIGTNATAIGVNAGNITTNATDIGTNATAIGVNAGNISTNTTDIGTNATAIGVNAGNISTNTTDIGTNATDIGTNATAIGVNAGNISTNTTDIGTNATAIGVNAGNISTNTTDIGTNATAIGVNAGAIAALTTDDVANSSLVDGGAGTASDALNTLLAASGGGSSERMFGAADLDEPNNSDWAVNSLAEMQVDSNDPMLNERVFDDTVVQGVGFDLLVPTGSTNLILRIISRAQSTPGGAVGVAPQLYRRGIPDNTAVGAWSSALALTTIAIPTNTNWQYDEQTISLATLGLTAGVNAFFELVRNGGLGGDTLAGDWNVYAIGVNFS